MDVETWKNIASVKQQRLSARSTYTAESLRVLNANGKKAGDALIEDISTTNDKQQQQQQRQQQQQQDEQRKYTNDSSNASSEPRSPGSSSPCSSSTPVVKPFRASDDQTSPKGLNETLFGMGYKKFKGIPWDVNEERLLDPVIYNPFNDFARHLDVVAVSILKKQELLDEIDFSLLKLCLSGIVNLLHTDHALLKLKNIVDEMALKVEERSKLKTRNDVNLPKKSWKRDLINMYVKVKKVKKNGC
ncbi:hypothetical protein DFQ28_005347 [Apophysomyces sp. BC1034]|nr:hypothetical protein DFQ30_005215 [Apophysomyces sp. BC1015]KAG0177864.1 hypothetical protein DFQ29_004261 [Apophysomyces sp. BC1021]KAG0188118.1 hypothetical protein DFQ28_005347 [Apophysomyces sp. BC1034]